MKNYLCEICEKHWTGDAKCPNCGEKHEIRVTMSPEEAEALGLK